MITHLNEKLIAVEVPSDAKKILKIKFDFNGNYVLESVCDKFKLKIPFDFKILGEVTKYEISFDVEPCVENKVLKSGLKVYKIYDKEFNGIYTSNKEESFLSLLKSKGIDTNKPNVKHVILEKV